MPLKFESVPPETVTSATVKVVEASLSTKVIVAVLPMVSAEVLLETAMAGGVVSICALSCMAV